MQCHICSSEDIKFLTAEGDKFTNERSNLCMNCGLVFLHPRMTDDEIHEYYLTDLFSRDFREEIQPSEEKRVRSRMRAKTQWITIGEHVPKVGKILDIGCSSGEFLAYAPDEYELYGVDPSTGFAESQESDSAQVRVGYFPEESFQDTVDKFDIITIFHTLEHVTNPREVLKGIHDRLTDDGTLIIEYPDVFRASYRPKFLKTYFQKSHFYDFSMFNLGPFLERNGFSIEFFAFYKNFPSDKNSILVCKKKVIETPFNYDPKQAEEMFKRISLKFKQVFLVRDLPLKIAHFASHNINIGDGAITVGIRNILSELYSSHVDFINLDIVDFTYKGTHISAKDINQFKPDLVLVGGGGTIDGHQARNLTGTAFMMPPEEMLKTKARFAFVALGHNAFQDQEFFNKEVLSDFIDFCSVNDYPFSVRMDRSFERMEQLLNRDLGKLISRVPDPGFFVVADEDANMYYTPWERKRVIIQIAFDAYTNRFGEGKDHLNWEKNIDRFIGIMGRAVSSLIREQNLDILLSSHTLDDLAASVMIANQLDERLRRIFVHTTPVAHPVFASMFFRAYADANLAIGMRGHSVICPIGLGTPTVAISTHDKVSGFMDEIDCGEWSLDPASKYFEDELQAAIQELSTKPELQLNKVNTNTHIWKDLLREFFIESLSGIE